MKEKGLTLLEVVIAISVVSIIGVLLLVIIINSAGVFYKESSKVSEGLNINDILSKVRLTLRQSSAVAAQYTSGNTTYTSGATRLVLKVPSVDSTNNIISNIYDYFVFFLDQSKLRMKSFPDSQSSRKAQDQIFSTLVDSLQFKYLNSTNPPIEVTPINALKVRIILTLKQKSGANFEINTATAEASLRND